MPKLPPAAERELISLSPEDLLHWYGLQHHRAAWWRRSRSWLSYQPHAARRWLLLWAADTDIGSAILWRLCRSRSIHSVACRGRSACRGAPGPHGRPGHRWPEWLQG